MDRVKERIMRKKGIGKEKAMRKRERDNNEKEGKREKAI